MVVSVRVAAAFARIRRLVVAHRRRRSLNDDVWSRAWLSVLAYLTVTASAAGSRPSFGGWGVWCVVSTVRARGGGGRAPGGGFVVWRSSVGSSAVSVVCVAGVWLACAWLPTFRRWLPYSLGVKRPWAGRSRRHTGVAAAKRTKAIWLILPVVICLSQRLSHACLSSHCLTVKPRMAH